MAKRDDDFFRMTRPTTYAGGMIFFLIFVGLLTFGLLEPIERAFWSNPFLNGLIFFVLFLGIIYSFNQIIRLVPAAKWIERYPFGDHSGAAPSYTAPPSLMVPMAALLNDRPNNHALNAAALRSILDSIGMRLDESREIMRYMVGLLVFLGLLGTFWGLLQTISSVGDSIKTLSSTESTPAHVFDDLIAGLQAPLSGMGIAFSSSLFGLSCSLILGFLDLRSGQAQNRFYNELEEYLATRTQILDTPPQPEPAPQAAVQYTSEPENEAGVAMLASLEEIKSLLALSLERLDDDRVRDADAQAELSAQLSEAANELSTSIHKLRIDRPTEQAEILDDIRNDIRVLTRAILQIAEAREE